MSKTTETISPKYAPTIIFEKQEEFYDLLSTNGDCELPCIWQIVPGKTLLKDAINIVGNYTGEYRFSEYKMSGSQPRYQYSDSFDVTTGIDIQTNVKFETSSAIVRGIRVSFDTSEGSFSQALPKEYFALYGLLNIFKSFGAPDYVFLNPPKISQGPEAYGIKIFYEEEKIMLSYDGNSTEIDENVYRLCPNIGDEDILFLTVVAADQNDPLIHIIPYGWDDFSLEPTTSRKAPVTLNPNELYDKYINEDTYCFLYDRNDLKVIYSQ